MFSHHEQFFRPGQERTHGERNAGYQRKQRGGSDAGGGTFSAPVNPLTVNTSTFQVSSTANYNTLAGT